MTQNFELGQVVVTRGVSELLQRNEWFSLEIAKAVWMYRNKQWGSLCEADAQMNEDALIHGDRILAKYETCEGDIYIITEWDRSVTTILFTHEY